MTLKTIMAGAAAIGLAVSPIAASAGTSAGASLPATQAGTVTLGERATTSVKKEERLAGPGLIIAIIAGIAIITGIIIAADDDDDDFSPGA
ncbi:hypothetical protein P8R33_07565 [Qipengyuania sp. XHP0211]|uniref:hypothetical protein n=1 Tax=Qipengyuania sp. XHP0211 TaxID=3038079 RepID=UPI00241FAEC3|nr:hypothetical protein [Qipengyuania sp. XHP0211]MDG5750958.1 hypothetical protein [Qipengyuania sp. XHP0211]